MQKKTEPSAAPAPSPYSIENPEEFARNLLRLIEAGGKALSTYLARSDAQMGPYAAASEMTEASKALSEIAQKWMADPARLAEAQSKLMMGFVDLWSNTVRRMSGDDIPPVMQPAPGDNRFKDPEWSNNAYFDFLKQAYLLATQWAEQALEQTKGLDERTRRRAEFYLEQVASAASPSNFPMTNPEVMRETLTSNARNLVQGMTQLAQDIEKSGDLLKISQTDTSAFEVGKNLAVTPGKVVYQNDIIQLIQYAPTTEKVRELPLLIVPPWINKFYILDLTQPKSFVKFAVDQGFTVFLVSWINPDARLKHKTFEDYMTEGVLAAADAVRRETGASKPNAIGYCVGGTLLATALAHAAARGNDPFNSATFFTTQVDFTQAGDLLLFIDDSQLKALEEMMCERGYLDGSRMATMFNMLRPKDLIWPYIVNNYMLGKKPFPFDLLFWNQDSTRMPPANHNFYLRTFYLENKLAKGELVLDGIKLDLRDVKIPVYNLASKEDHIAPARSAFIGAKLFGGPVEFVVAGSGHIAGVINPPDAKRVKYQYWTNPALASVGSLEDWLAAAKETPGSWWPHWAAWLTARSGDWVEPRAPGAKLGVIEDAPGSYVRIKG
ncbi:MAG: PHA/PHB synthase family protein [Hyphomicrobiaceae bacterium]